MNNLPGDPATYPANVRAPSDDENRNDTVFGRPLQDLADRTAFLHRRDVGLSVASLFDLIALSGVTVGDCATVRSYGQYFYTMSSLTALSPWVMAAGGMGAGYWVHAARKPLLNESDGGIGMQPKIDPALLGPQLYYGGPLTLPSPLVPQQVTSATPTVVATVDFPNLLVGDQVVGMYGPIGLYNTAVAAADYATVMVAYQDDATGTAPPGGAMAHVLIPGTASINIPHSAGPWTIPFSHTIGVAGTLRITLEAYTTGGNILWATFFDQVFGHTGQLTIYRGTE